MPSKYNQYTFNCTLTYAKSLLKYNPYTFKLHTSLHRSVPSIMTFAINWALRKQLIYLSSQSHRHLLLARLTDWHLARLTDFYHLLVKLKELCPFVKGILDQKCAPFCSVLNIQKKKYVSINMNVVFLGYIPYCIQSIIRIPIPYTPCTHILCCRLSMSLTAQM